MFPDTQLIDTNQVSRIVETRAHKKGFANYRYGDLEMLKNGITHAAITVVSDYNLAELYQAALKASRSDTAYNWYRSWTKNYILAGDPQKIAPSTQLTYLGQNVGLYGPAPVADTTLKTLYSTLVPLTTPVIDCRVFTQSSDSNFRINFHYTHMTLPKFIIQLMHIFAEVTLENGQTWGVPTITFQVEEPQSYISKYHRIDKGGLGLPDEAVCSATAYIL